MMALTAAQKKAERIASLQEQEVAASAFGADLFKEIYDKSGNLVTISTSGPNAGRDILTGEVVIEGSAPVNPVKPVKPIEPLTTGPKTFTATDGKVFTDEAAFSTYQASLNTQETAKATAAQEAAAAAEKKRREGQSAYSLLFAEFDRYGMGALVEPLKQFIQDGLSDAEFTLRLRETDAYKKRFAANAQRVAKGLRSLSEAEYVGMEDQYQNVMRQYGLPESYYSRGEMGKQEGFEKFIAGDVSAVELEDRISTAQKRVLNANPEVTQALKQFYPDITNADILAYTLDPKNAIENIKRKVTAAEIGGAALSQTGLTTSLARAEELQKYGVDKAAATAGYSAIGDSLQRGSQLAAIYGESPYTQATAESEVFKLSGQQEARKQRQKVTGLEKAAFGGQTGITSGALARDRAGGY
jgi:hypothetical protein